MQAPTTWNRRWQQWKDHQIDCEKRTCCSIYKTEQIAHLQGKDHLERQNAIQDMLTAYRSTPHPAMGITAYEAMRGATIRTKLDHIQPKVQRSEKDDTIDERDAMYKQKNNEREQRRQKHRTRKTSASWLHVGQAREKKQMEHAIQTRILYCRQDQWIQNHSQMSYWWENNLQKYQPLQTCKRSHQLHRWPRDHWSRRIRHNSWPRPGEVYFI